MKKLILAVSLLTLGFSLQITPAAMLDNNDKYSLNNQFDAENYPQISGFSLGWNKAELLDRLADHIPAIAKELAEERAQGENPLAGISLAGRLQYTRDIIAEMQKLANDPEALVNNRKLTKDEKMKLYSAIARARNALR